MVKGFSFAHLVSFVRFSFLISTLCCASLICLSSLMISSNKLEESLPQNITNSKVSAKLFTTVSNNVSARLAPMLIDDFSKKSVCFSKADETSASFDLASLLNILIPSAHADILAPAAPPELSDTLIDFRTKEQQSEQVYIEGRADPKDSLEVPTVPGDREARVMRLSANYVPQYAIAVPRHGDSILRFYDLNGVPLEIVATKVENQGFVAETTAAPSELLIRQFQGASSSLMQVKIKGINQNFIFMLKPLVLVNQERSVRTLITSMTLNYYVDGVNYIEPRVIDFDRPNPQAKALNFDKVQFERLQKDLIDASSVVLPLSDFEQKRSKEILDKLFDLDAQHK